MTAELAKLKIPEPINYRGRERLVGGWNTAGVAQWLVGKKLGEHYTSVSEVASFAYDRDCPTNRASVRRNLSVLRRHLGERNEFLLTAHGRANLTTALKVCNPADDNDRQVATEQLLRLEARCEITQAERERWEQMLYLPSTEVTVQQENQS